MSRHERNALRVRPGAVALATGLSGMFAPAMAPAQTADSRDGASAASVVTVAAGEFVGEHGRLETAMMFSPLRARVEAWRVCADRALHANPQFTGRVGLELSVNASGRVTDSRVSGLAPGDTLAPCIERVVRGIAFPATGGAVVRYRTTLSIAPGRGGGEPAHGPGVSANPVAAAASTINRPAFQRAIRSHHDEFDSCYQLALRHDPTAEGRVVVRFEIAPDGHVVEATLAESDHGLDAVGECIAGHASGWTFDPPGGSGPVTTTYPFNFTNTQ
jgi:hypothetical protein